MKKWNIFVSHGTPYNAAQERFCAKFRKFLESRGCECATIGQNKHGVRHPVELARDAIAECDGAAVIAFKRIEVASGTEKPGSSASTSVDGRILPTVWNHLEGAMAYAHHLPLFVIVESGVHREGMLSKRLEWDALEVDITSKVFASDKFQQRFGHWLSFVESHSRKASHSELDAGKLTLKRILQSLTPAQVWALLGATFVVLSSVATIAYKIGEWATHAKP